MKTKILVMILLAVTGCSQHHPAPMPEIKQPTVRIAGIVLKWVIADKETNYRRVEPLIRDAAAKGAQIVMTTECFLDGYAIQDKSIPLEKWRALCERIPDGVYVKRLTQLAAELRIHLVAGLTECVGDNTYNTAILIGPDGKIIGKYHKHKLEHESVRNTPGSSYPVFDTQFGKIGLMICADRREPELVKQLKDNGAQFLLCPSGGMWGPKDNDHILQDRSRENSIDIIFVHPIEFLVTNQYGVIVDRHFIGEELLLSPEELSGPKDQHSVIIYDLPIPQP